MQNYCFFLLEQKKLGIKFLGIANQVFGGGEKNMYICNKHIIHQDYDNIFIK